MGSTSAALKRLQDRIVSCRKCPRLVEHREHVAQEKQPKFAHWKYWGAPVPSYGDPSARLLLVGLAPASHGANRTGRMFTGDQTADSLTASLYRAGFANKPTSRHRGDGLSLIDVYETAAVRCAPPGDRPTALEQRSCRPFLEEEIGLLANIRVVLTFGHIAFQNFFQVISERTGKRIRPAFRHGARYYLGETLPLLLASYHPSPRNINTGRLTTEGLDSVIADALRLVRIAD